MGPEYLIKEQICSVVALVLLVYVFIFPVMIYWLYTRKIRRNDPYPDLKSDYMEVEDLRAIYDTINVEQIHKSYTVSKHEKFMGRYGVLISG